MGTRSRRYVIVGDGAAGVTAARQLRAGDAKAHITLISDDPNPAYFRAALTNYLLGELREEQIWATTPNFYDQHQLQRLHSRVRALEPARAAVHLSHGGAPLSYDALLVASGARARTLRCDGNHLRGLMTLRTLQDCRAVMELISSSVLQHAVVVGGGPLALEWALGMHVRGIRVTVVLRGTSFMAGALDAVASDLLLARLKHAGIEVILKDEIVAAIDRGDGHVGRIQTRTGLSIECQLVAGAIGVVPNTEWLAATGVQLSQSGGIVVDEQMRTSLANVFAAGDAASFQSQPLQLWEPAQSQARVAAANMAGHSARYAPGVHYMATRLFDLDFASLGAVEAQPGAQVLLDYPQGTGKIKYRKLLIHDGKLVGALLLGHREDRIRQGARLFKRLIDSQVNVQRIQAELLSPSFNLKAWLDGQGLVHKESTRADVAIAKAADIRGTNVLDLSQLGALRDGKAKPAASASGTAAIFSLATPALSNLSGQGPSKDVDAATQALGTQVLSQFNSRQGASGVPPGTAQLTIDQARPAVLEGAGQRWPLTEPIYRMGRSPEGEVVLQDPSVELVHANIQRFGADWYLRDVGSRGGTWVNNEQLSVPRRLASPDKIRIGQTELVFRFSDDTAEAPQAPSAPRLGPAMPRLLVQSGRSLGLSFVLTESPTLVGRDPSCGVWLDDPALAPQHAKLERRQERWVASSLGAALWHNQRGLAPGTPIQLQEGDHLQLGSITVLFTQTPLPEETAEPASSIEHSRVSSGQRAAQLKAFVQPPAPVVPHKTLGFLRVHSGPKAGETFELSESFVVGSGAECQLALSAEGVAERHLELRWYQGQLWALDLGSPFGTTKSGAKLTQTAAAVAAGDWFSLGRHVTLVYQETP